LAARLKSWPSRTFSGELLCGALSLLRDRDPSAAERDPKGESRSFAQDDRSQEHERTKIEVKIKIKVKSSGQECPLHMNILCGGSPSAAEAGDIVAAWRHD
jgi:hypothetical protein